MQIIIDKLYKLQKRAARMIYNMPMRTASEPLFRKLNWMPLTDRIKYRKNLLVFKSLNALAPAYMENMFKYVHNTHSRNTRSALSKKLSLPSGSHLKIFTNSFAYSAANSWNSLPDFVRDSNSLNCYKRSYLTWYFKK